MLNVALTGNVASGKSTVASHWAEAGVAVVSADELARQAVAPGTPGLQAVREAFGDEVMATDGSLDRAVLRGRVFDRPDERKRLEEILHPRIRALRDQWMAERRAEGVSMVVSEIPLLFETGLHAGFDVVVVVDAPEAARLERLMERRGLDANDARKMMAAQMDSSEKRTLATHVLDNSGSEAELRTAALELLAELRRRAAGGVMRLDLHLHTGGSWDCLSDPRAVLQRARARRIGRIAITDHDRLEVALRMADAFPDEVIAGEEVKTAEGIDVLGLYLTKEIPKGTPAAEVVERIREQGGVPYLPHPYAAGKGGGGRYAEELAPLVDVVEVFNARLHPGRLNLPAEDLAERHGRLRGAGSDAHTVREVGGAFVEVPLHANDAGALRDALASARIEGRTSSNLVHLASTWAKVRKKLPGAPRPLDRLRPPGR